MITSSILVVFGLLLLLYCADLMIMCADVIAKEFSLSPILIGLTIVAFGTSAPELVITMIASLKDTEKNIVSPPKLRTKTTYYWQVGAVKNSGIETRSPVWVFTTTGTQ